MDWLPNGQFIYTKHRYKMVKRYVVLISSIRPSFLLCLANALFPLCIHFEHVADGHIPSGHVSAWTLFLYFWDIVWTLCGRTHLLGHTAR